MLARVSVPILPFRSRGGIVADSARGAVVTVYNGQGDGTAAVSEYGVVATTATTAYVYNNREGSIVMQNPVTLDDFGGPNDMANRGGVVSLSFYAFPGVYDLLVVMPNGQRFGIPGMQASLDPLAWHNWEMPGPYNYDDSAASDWGVSIPYNYPVVSGVNLLQNFARQMSPAAPVGANKMAWAGEEIYQTGLLSGGDYYEGHPSEPNTNAWRRLMIITAGVMVDAGTASDAGTIFGFCFGLNQATSIATNPANPIVALYLQMDVPKWTVLLAPGGGTAVRSVLTGVHAPTPYTRHRCKILFNPNGGVLEAYVDGTLGARITTVSAFPTVAGSDSKYTQLGIFSGRGATAGDSMQGSCVMLRQFVSLPL